MYRSNGRDKSIHFLRFFLVVNCVELDCISSAILPFLLLFVSFLFYLIFWMIVDFLDHQFNSTHAYIIILIRIKKKSFIFLMEAKCHLNRWVRVYKNNKGKTEITDENFLSKRTLELFLRYDNHLFLFDCCFGSCCLFHSFYCDDFACIQQSPNAHWIIIF